MSADPGREVIVHLVRHGKVHNPDDLLYGCLPGYRLAASGRAMADAVASALYRAPAAAGAGTGDPVHRIGHLAASPLQRAQETAAPLARLLGRSVTTDDRLIEAGNAFEGTRVALNRATLLNPRTWSRMRNPFTPSWGEPYLQIAHRMLAAVYAAVDAVERAPGSREAVLVSHQLPIVTVRRYLLGQHLWHDPRKRQCSVASVSSLTFVDGVFDRLDYTEPAGHIAAVNDPEPAPGTPARSEGAQ